MVSTAVTTLFRAKLSATVVAETIEPVLNVVFCLTATGTPKGTHALKITASDVLLIGSHFFIDKNRMTLHV
jgi:hypothetical protein